MTEETWATFGKAITLILSIPALAGVWWIFLMLVGELSKWTKDKLVGVFCDAKEIRWARVWMAWKRQGGFKRENLAAYLIEAISKDLGCETTKTARAFQFYGDHLEAIGDIEQLRQSEGHHVSLFCDNPEAVDADCQTFVEVGGDFTGWEVERFYGRDWAAALKKAADRSRAFNAAEKQETADIPEA